MDDCSAGVDCVPRRSASGLSRPWSPGIAAVTSGLSAVVIADLVSVAISSRWPNIREQSETRDLRTYSFHAFVLAAVAPALVLSTGTVLVVGARQMVEGANRLRDSALVLSDHVDEYLSGHTRAIEALAATLSLLGDDQKQRERVLTEYVKVQTGFESLRVVSIQGDVTASAPPLPNLTKLSVADRAFFTEAIRTHKSTISDVTLGRLRPVTIVAISAPLFSAPDHANGVTYGVLDLAKFRHFVEQYQGWPDATVIILDHLNRVIYTTEHSPRCARICPTTAGASQRATVGERLRLHAQGCWGGQCGAGRQGRTGEAGRLEGVRGATASEHAPAGRMRADARVDCAGVGRRRDGGAILQRCRPSHSSGSLHHAQCLGGGHAFRSADASCSRRNRGAGGKTSTACRHGWRTQESAETAVTGRGDLN